MRRGVSKSETHWIRRSLTEAIDQVFACTVGYVGQLDFKQAKTI